MDRSCERSAVSASETEIPVADASIFRPKDLVKVTATGEVLFVEAIDETEGQIQSPLTVHMAKPLPRKFQ